MNGPRKLWLYRHGPLAVPPDLCVGWTDVPLADAAQTGDEARRLAKQIVKADAVYTSDLTRTRQTAAPLAKALGVDLQPTRELREMHFGEWENQRWSLLQETAAQTFADYMSNWITTPTPAGESFAGLIDRLGAFWQQVVRDHDGQTVVLVSHGAALAALTVHLLGWTPHDAMKHMIKRGRYSYLDRERQAYAWNFDPARLP